MSATLGNTHTQRHLDIAKAHHITWMLATIQRTCQLVLSYDGPSWDCSCTGKGNRRSVAIQSTSTSMVTNALFHSCIAARKSDRYGLCKASLWHHKVLSAPGGRWDCSCTGKGNRRSVAIQSASSMVTNALFHPCIAARKSDMREPHFCIWDHFGLEVDNKDLANHN